MHEPGHPRIVGHDDQHLDGVVHLPQDVEVAVEAVAVETGVELRLRGARELDRRGGPGLAGAQRRRDDDRFGEGDAGREEAAERGRVRHTALGQGALGVARRPGDGFGVADEDEDEDEGSRRHRGSLPGGRTGDVPRGMCTRGRVVPHAVRVSTADGDVAEGRPRAGADDDVSELVALARELPVLAALTRVARRVVRRAGVGLPTLPDAQVEVLRVVEATPGVGTGRVAEQLQLVPNTVSTLVGELVAAGLLTRERDAADRRAARLHLTPAAVDALARWGAVRDDVVSRALARLDPADRQALADCLPAARRLLAALDSADPLVEAAAGAREGGRRSDGPT